MPNFPIVNNVELIGGAEIVNLRPEVVAALPASPIEAIIAYLTGTTDLYFHNGTRWVSMSGHQSANNNADVANAAYGVLNGMAADGTYQFRSIATGSSKVTITLVDGNITIDLGVVPISAITGLQDALDGKEPAFSKNSAFNKNFGTTAGTVAEGNDSRLSNARTPLAHNQGASTINAMDSYAIGTTDVAIAASDSLNVAMGKLEYLSRNKLIANVTFNSTTQTLSFLSKSGAVLATVDLVLESVMQGVAYNSTTKVLTFTLVSGATTTISLTDLIDAYTGGTANGLTVTISAGVISVSIVDGSIAKAKLNAALQTEIDAKALNAQTLGTITASDTEAVTTATTLLAILQSFAKNIKSLFAKFLKLNLSRCYVSPALTGASGTITLATHEVANPKTISFTLNGVPGIIYANIDASTKDVTWASSLIFVAADKAVLTILG